jgi:hypothetical protein
MNKITRNPFLAALALTAAQVFNEPNQKLQASQEVVRTAMPLPPAVNRMLKMQRRAVKVKGRKFTDQDQLRIDAAQAKRARRQQRNIRNQQFQMAGEI